MARNYEKRAAEIFRACNGEINAKTEAMVAEHSAAGRLKSGATAIRAVTIFEEESRLALGKSLDEMAKQIEHRGREWNAATAAIGRALESHVGEARAVLERPLQLAGATGGTAAARAIDLRLNEIAESLRGQLNEFHEGWTAPVPKPWKERHPNLDRIIFAVIGAVIAGGVTLALGWWSHNQTRVDGRQPQCANSPASATEVTPKAS